MPEATAQTEMEVDVNSEAKPTAPQAKAKVKKTAARKQLKKFNLRNQEARKWLLLNPQPTRS